MDGTGGSGLDEVVLEFQLYLSDREAPMLAVEAVETLLHGPAEVVAREIEAWTSAQYQGTGSSIPVSDYLFHALKKIHLLTEFGLIQPLVLLPRLAAVAHALETFCPEEERTALRASVARLGEARMVAASAPVETLYRQAGPDQPGAQRSVRGEAGGGGGDEVDPGELTHALKRFNTLLGRISGPQGSARAVQGPQRQTLEGELLATAATTAHTVAELEGYLQRLKGAGFDVPREKLMRTLGDALPEWGVLLGPEVPEGVTGEGPQSLVGAMGRLVSLAGTPEEGARRFHEMVQAAVEFFEEGSLPRSVTVFDVADRIVRKEKIPAAIVVSVKEQTQRALSPARLKAFAEKPDQHVLLRRVLDFFPAFSPKGLLASLRDEQSREGRRLLLALLTVHGAAAREAAFEAIEQALQHEDAGSGWQYLRNLLYVARRAQEGILEISPFETDCVSRLSETTLPPALVKEAIATLGMIRSEEAASALLLRLGQLEAELGQTGLSPEKRSETEGILERTVAALVRQGSPKGLRGVVEHGLRTSPFLGDTRGRLSQLSGTDLSVDEVAVGLLVEELRAALPLRVLSFLIQTTKAKLLPLVTALSGTPTPAVRKLLVLVARRFPDVDYGQAAASALAAFDAPPRDASEKGGESSLSGDLDVFGFPTLVQTLQQSRSTGLLTLRGRSGEEMAAVHLEDGKLRACTAAGLRGVEAFYQILQRPSAGTFRFATRALSGPEDAALEKTREIIPLLMEGMTRHDELRRATALVADGARLVPTGTRPTAHPEDNDGAILKACWERVLTGATASECETAAPVDAFRVRRLLAHWVSEGSLRIAAGGPRPG